MSNEGLPKRFRALEQMRLARFCSLRPTPLISDRISFITFTHRLVTRRVPQTGCHCLKRHFVPNTLFLWLQLRSSVGSETAASDAGANIHHRLTLCARRQAGRYVPGVVAAATLRLVVRAYGQGGSGGRQERSIYIQKIGESDPKRLTFAPEDDRQPAWSPDGRSIAFCRMIDERPPFRGFVVNVIPAAGGAERRIAEGSEGVSWSPDSKTLAVAGLPPEAGGILRISLDTRRTDSTDPFRVSSGRASGFFP